MSNPIPGDDAERAIFDVLYEMRLAPRHQLEEAAKRIAALPADVAADNTPTEILAKVMTRDGFNCSTELGYAQFLAWAIWLKSYRSVSPEFTIMGNLLGALSQIDNMACGLSLAAGAPAETVKATCLISSEANWSDAKIVEVLNSCGVDTYPSKHGFSATQVSATSIPTLRAVLEILATPSPSAEVARDAIPVDSLCALLPGPYYMDLPDGGDVSVLEQLRRMSVDASRYRWLIQQIPCGISQDLQCGISEIGVEIDDAIAAMKLQAPAKEGGA